MSKTTSLLSWICLACLLSMSPSIALSQGDLDAAPIHYLKSEAHDAVALLKEALEREPEAVTHDAETGWLPYLMQQLEISKTSQTLVFSKTSLQIRYISPDNPRALYFNDDIYMGYVPGGKVIELSAVDPQLGAVFYTVDQARKDRLIIQRENHQCLSCHASAKTQGVPGYLVRSVYPGQTGHPVYALGTTTTDHTTDFKDRFGGWFVTTPWTQPHRGNAFVEDQRDRTQLPPLQPLISPSQTLQQRISAEKYLHAESDLAALMILEHQSQGHNLITAANWDVRRALDYQRVMNDALDRSPDYQSESTIRRIDRAADRIVDYFLFRNEAQWTAPVAATQFATHFQNQGPKDHMGRNLRQWGGDTRLFRYPCSFLIYTQSFAQLPAPVHQRVLVRIRQILTSKEGEAGFEHLSNDDRWAIHEILSDTLPEYAAVSDPQS